MKKIYPVLLILLLIYLFGLFSYDLARPLDEQVGKKIEQNRDDVKAGTSSQAMVDLNVIKDINSLVAGEVLPSSKLYDLKIFGEKLRLYFAKTEKEVAQLRVNFLNRRLAEAEVLLESGKTGQAQQLVNQFAKGSENLMLELKKQEYLRLDPSLATEIEQSIASQIDLQKSLMAGIGSSSPLFPIKSRLLDLELQMADTPEEKKIVMEEQATEKQQKIITSENTKKIQLMTDWQIFKKEINILGANLKRYGTDNGQKLHTAYVRVRSWTDKIISKYKN